MVTMGKSNQISGQINMSDYLKVHPVEIMDICDDAFCPICGDGIDELNWMDCERCPSCWARISWEPWHRANDRENEEIWGPDWRDRFGKMLKKTKEE